MKAHFFDLESIISSDSKVWIVDRKSPKFPVMRISQSEFNLIKSGIYKSQGNQIKFAGKEYWIPEEMMGSLKIKCKNLKSDVSNLAFSMREYMDSDLIDSAEYEIGFDILRHLKNSQDDVYFICSENTKENYERIISKIESKLEELGIPAREQSKNVFRIDTEHGAVMYYPPSNKWQHRGKVHRGDIKSFHGWLKNQGYIQ